jgi:SAM-dependent methyltransferase
MPRINNKDFYNASIQKYGFQPKGVHWNSKQSQHTRFHIIKDFIPNINISGIVDAGCGFGDLYIFLNKQVSLPNRYTGIDCEEIVNKIRKSLKLALKSFKCSNKWNAKQFEDRLVTAMTTEILKKTKSCIVQEYKKLHKVVWNAVVSGFEDGTGLKYEDYKDMNMSSSKFPNIDYNFVLSRCVYNSTKAFSESLILIFK